MAYTVVCTLQTRVCVCVYMRNKSDAGTYYIDFFFNPRRMIYRINSTTTSRENYQIKTAPSPAGRHSGHPGFLPFFIISVYFSIYIYMLYTHTLRILPPPRPNHCFLLFISPDFYTFFFVPRARGPVIVWKTDVPYIFTIRIV